MGGPLRGFTLIEVLVATAVLALLLVLTLQILGNTSTVSRTSDRRMDAAAQARGALARFGADFSGAMLSHGATALGTVADAGDPASIAFLSRARARAASSGAPAWQNDLRGAMIAYRMNERSLERGDGRFTFSGQDPGNHVASDLSAVFTGMAGALDSGGNFLEWTPLGEGVVRFHVSYQLDDGTVTQTPPEYTMTSPQTGNPTTFLNGANVSPALAIAFTPQNAPAAGPHPGRHVRALIVGVAVVDRLTLEQSSDHLDELDDLGTPGVAPSGDTDTPLVLWQDNLDEIAFPPLRQNLRFYQRLIPVP